MTLHKYKSPQWLIVSALGLVMIFTWGSTYYLLAILAEPIASDTSWSIGSVTGALSIGLLIASLSSPFVGRKIQNGSGRSILAIGCSLICTGLCTIGIAPNIWIFWTGWSVIGFGMAAGLYDPAFATLGKLYGRDARRSIVQLTLIGGFASTFCWPLSALMLETWGWRGTVFGYAAINATICFPIVIFLIPSSTNDVIQKEYQTIFSETKLTAQENQSFLICASIQVVHGLIIVNMSALIFTYLQAKGLSMASSVAIAALMGPAQVAARLIELANKERHHPIWTLSISVTMVTIGLLMLAIGSEFAALAIILFGIGNGLFSIARGSLPLAFYGGDRYPSIIGALARPWLMAQSCAPILGILLIIYIGPQASLKCLAVFSSLNIILVSWLWKASIELR